MALSHENVYTAKTILAEMMGWERGAHFSNTVAGSGADYVGTIMLDGEKSDGGWECVYINIPDITPAQLAIFNARKKEVHNSSFMYEPNQYGVTRLGWF